MEVKAAKVKKTTKTVKTAKTVKTVKTGTPKMCDTSEYDLKVSELISKTDDGKWICSSCSQVFESRARVLKHAEQHIDGYQLPCLICDKTFSMKRNLKQHIYNNHKEEKEGTKERKSKKDNSTKNKESKKGKENNISQKKSTTKKEKPGNPTKKNAEVLIENKVKSD